MPTIALIRDPFDQLLSAKTYHPEISVNILLDELLWYYEELEQLSRIIISDFDRTTKDPESVLFELQKKFKNSFAKYNIKSFDDDFVFKSIEKRKSDMVTIQNKKPIPSKEKDALKKKYEMEISNILGKEIGTQLKQSYLRLKKISDSEWKKNKNK